MRKTALTFDTLEEAMRFEIKDARKHRDSLRAIARQAREAVDDYGVQIAALEAKLRATESKYRGGEL